MMVATRNVGFLIGSLRKASFTRRLADAMAKLAPETLSLGGVSAIEQSCGSTNAGGFSEALAAFAGAPRSICVRVRQRSTGRKSCSAPPCF